MADDMTEAEATMANLQGVENHPQGVILVRVVRLLRAARTKFAATDARIAALEDRVRAPWIVSEGARTLRRGLEDVR
jgi:hypothetical protein